MIDCKHECHICKPDMLPDYDINSSEIHNLAKDGRYYSVLDDGRNVGFTSGITKTGKEGFYLLAGKDTEEICTHKHSDGQHYVCLKLIFSKNVSIEHAV